MASRPEVRERILKRMAWSSFRADSLKELRLKLCMEDVSLTQFCKALGSLHFNYRLISVIRHGPESLHDSRRPYKLVALRPTS